MGFPFWNIMILSFIFLFVFRFLLTQSLLGNRRLCCHLGYWQNFNFVILSEFGLRSRRRIIIIFLNCLLCETSNRIWVGFTLFHFDIFIRFVLFGHKRDWWYQFFRLLWALYWSLLCFVWTLDISLIKTIWKTFSCNINWI